MVVEVGLVVGTIPQTTPTGSAISVIPVYIVFTDNTHGFQIAQAAHDVFAGKQVFRRLIFQIRRVPFLQPRAWRVHHVCPARQ